MLTRKAWSGFALLALWLVLESAISWAGFCYEGQDERPEQYAGEADSCILRGPLALLIKGFFRWWARTFHDADAYVALFTALLFVSTVALWLSTRRLWRHCFGRDQ